MNAFKENEKNGRIALSLWKRWFRKSGDPMYRGLRMICFFCGMVQMPSGKPRHKKGCAYMEAKTLMDSEKDGIHKA